MSIISETTRQPKCPDCGERQTGVDALDKHIHGGLCRMDYYGRARRNRLKQGIKNPGDKEPTRRIHNYNVGIVAWPDDENYIGALIWLHGHVKSTSPYNALMLFARQHHIELDDTHRAIGYCDYDYFNKKGKPVAVSGLDLRDTHNNLQLYYYGGPVGLCLSAWDED